MKSSVLEETHAQRDFGVLLVDVRSATEFRSGHVPGAYNIPLEEMESRLDDLDTERRIVLICKSGQRAGLAARCLEANGVDASADSGGTDAWVKAGLELVVSTRTRWSLERQVRLAAGALALMGVVLALSVNPNWLYVAAFVGLGLTVAGITDFCPMARVVSAMPWNGTSRRRRHDSSSPAPDTLRKKE